jgi:hypothetical protein
MKAKSSEPTAEVLRILRQIGEMPSTPAAPDSSFAGRPDDLGELFLAELRSRRERLAKWLDLLHAEAGRQPVSSRQARRSRHLCRGHASRRPGYRSSQGL